MSTTNPPADAAKLRELLEKASPGEWFIVAYGDGDSITIHSDDVRRVCFMATPGSSPDAMERIEANAELIVTAKNALPTLLDLLAAQASQIEALTAENDETYELGKRDGYESAVQRIDIEAGGDGEYRYCMGQKDWPETHCPDAGSMKIRISNRFTALQSRATAAEAKVAQLEEYYNSARIELADEVARREIAEAKAAKMREALQMLCERFDTFAGQPYVNPSDSAWALARAAIDQEARS